MAKRRRQQKTAMVGAAEGIGRTLGQLVNRLEKLQKQRNAITARIEHLAHAGSEMFAKLKPDTGGSTRGRRAAGRGRKGGFKISAATRRKMSIAAKKRHAAKRASEKD